MLKLRNFQKDATRKTWESPTNSEGKKAIGIISPTGAGKTIIACALAFKEIETNDGQVLFIVPRDSLVRQTAEKMAMFGIDDVGYICGGRKEKRLAPLQIASYQSLGSETRDLSWLSPTMAIADECHVTAFCQSLQSIFAKTACRIGLTATPWQSDQKRGLSQIFDNFVFTPNPGELIKQGLLTKPVYLSGSNQKGTFDLEVPVDYIFEQWIKLAFGEPTFFFAGSVAQSEAIADYFQSEGINVVSITGKTPRQEAEELLQAFDRGEIEGVSSCAKLIEGCDIQRASVAALCSRSKSRSRVIQKIGRVTRLFPGKPYCKVLDFVRSAEMHGRFDQIQITGADLQPGAQESGSPPVKPCENCGKWSYASARICTPVDKTKGCGSYFTIQLKLYDNPEGDLRRSLLTPLESSKIAYYHWQLSIGFKQNQPYNFAEQAYYQRFKEYPELDWLIDAPGQQVQEFRAYCQQIRSLSLKRIQLSLF